MCKSTTDTSTFNCKCLEDELNMISIPVSDYEFLQASTKTLHWLIACGVDNWEGYQNAMLSIGGEAA